MGDAKENNPRGWLNCRQGGGGHETSSCQCLALILLCSNLGGWRRRGRDRQAEVVGYTSLGLKAFLFDYYVVLCNSLGGLILVAGLFLALSPPYERIWAITQYYGREGRCMIIAFRQDRKKYGGYSVRMHVLSVLSA